MGFYDEMQDFASEMLEEFNQGTITLTRKEYAAPTNPWEQGAETPVTYTLDATVRGAASKYVDGTLILASDLQVMVSTSARNSDGDRVAIVPQMNDAITVNSKAKTPKKIMPIPASGTVAAYLVFVEG